MSYFDIIVNVCISSYGLFHGEVFFDSESAIVFYLMEKVKNISISATIVFSWLKVREKN